jgi:hypothetical protein
MAKQAGDASPSQIKVSEAPKSPKKLAGRARSTADAVTVTLEVPQGFLVSAGIGPRPGPIPPAGIHFIRQWSGSAGPGNYLLTASVEGPALATGTFTLTGATLVPPSTTSFTIESAPVGEMGFVTKHLYLTVGSRKAPARKTKS